MSSYEIANAVRQGRSLAGVCPIVDLHGHAGPYREFLVLGGDPDAMVAVMDRVGMEALMVAPHIAIGPSARDGNDIALDMVRRYPGRFYGYAVPYPHEPEKAGDELRRALDAGLTAIKLHPGMHQYRIVDPGYKVAFDVAAERGTFILIHTWKSDPLCSTAMLADLAREYPTVPVLMGHSGGGPAGFPEFIELARTHSSLYLDTTCSYMFGAWLRRMVEGAGVEKVVYGSDLPFIDVRYGLGKVALSGLDDDNLRAVLRDNGRRLLRGAGVNL